jgi:hypothetical protein
MHYDSDPGRCKVSFWKRDGKKWSHDDTIQMSHFYNVNLIHTAVELSLGLYFAARAFDIGEDHSHDNLWAFVNDPYHKNAHPVCIILSGDNTPAQLAAAYKVWKRASDKKSNPSKVIGSKLFSKDITPEDIAQAFIAIGVEDDSPLAEILRDPAAQQDILNIFTEELGNVLPLETSD